MKFTAALAQFSPRLGNLKANLAKHLETLATAKDSGADLVLFPELSLTGYYLQDLLYEVAITPTDDDPIFGELIKASRDLELDTVFGFPESDGRGRYYISAAYLSRGEVLHVHRKVYLPTYGMFIDGRFFNPGKHLRAFDTRFGRAAILICEDFWHVSAPYLQWLDGADLFLFPTDSPGRGISTEPEIGTARWAQKLASMYGTLFGAHILYCNRTGYEDGISFFGGSLAVDPEGAIIAQAPALEEAITYVPIDTAQVRRSRALQPLLRDENIPLVQAELARIAAAITEG